MKNKISTLSMTMALLAMYSCSDDVPATGSGTPVGPGVEIQFGASLAGPSDNSRTYYGEPDTQNGVSVWPIFWNANTSNLDHLFIYSPQANGSRNQANYTVHPDPSQRNRAANITKDGAFGVQTGSDENTYDFYAIYPASAVTAPATGGTGTSSPVITATLPGEQTVVFTGTVDPAGTEDVTSAEVPDAVVGNVTYYTKPDMNACLMSAVNKGVNLANTPSVNLQFTPLSSCIDITINGPLTNSITGETTARITSVILSSKTGCLSGGFTYDSETITPVNRADRAAHIVTIDTKFLDKANNIVGVPLQSNNALRLQAFILPDKEIKDLTVTIVTADYKVRNFDLNINNMVAGQIHPARSPRINLDEGKVDYSIWLSQLDPRIYISELSLPGSCLSFNSSSIVGGLAADQITQSGTIADQFNAGVRVFQAHCWPASDGGSLHLVTSSGHDTGVRLLDMLEQLKNEMISNHGNEFCVVMLSDYDTNNGRDFADFYSLYKVLSSQYEQEGLLATDVGPNTTIEEVRDKVILKLALNPTMSDAGGNLIPRLKVAKVNETLGYLKSMSDLTGSQSLYNVFRTSAGSELTYSPLSFGGAGTFTYTEAYTSGWQDLIYNNATLTGGTPGFIYDFADHFISSTGTLVGDLNLKFTNNPTNYDDGFWYTYIEQANPSSVNFDNISEVVGSIKADYKQQYHNKIYMIYCGGAGGNVSGGVAAVTSGALAKWDQVLCAKTATTEKVDNLGNCPAGWVLFNQVTSEETGKRISTVINQNIKEGFLLNRDYNQVPVSKVAPNGDTQGTNHGGSIFGN